MREVAARGLVSVMPQPCTIGTPKRSSKARISDSGTAEPPHLTSVRLERSGGGSSSSMPCQIVGTPAERVTRSEAIRSASSAGVMRGPGKTSRAPASAAAYGMPHALAWNIGTTGITASAARRPIASGLSTPSECSTVERCEYTTPLGRPVVPLV